MNGLVRDLRFGVRWLRRTPGFTAIAILSLALGIGANTAVFSLVNAVLLRAPAVAAPERLVEAYITAPGSAFVPFSFPDLRDFERATPGIFTGVAASQLTFMPLPGQAPGSAVVAELVNGGYFETLGIRPHLGRLFSAAEDRGRGAYPVVVLSYAHWREAYGGDPTVLGRTLRLTGRDYTIIGVAPESYTGNLRGLAPRLYLPASMLNQLQPVTRDQLEQRGNRGVFLKARLAPGVTLAQAHAAADAFAADMIREYPDEWAPRWRVLLVPLTAVMVNPVLDRILVPIAALLFVLVGLVLLIACANLASFLLARARDRQREVAIRLALGAGRRLLVRQLLVESMLLALAGGCAGVLLARVLLAVLVSIDLPFPVPITLDLRLDSTVLAFALAASFGSGILFGLAPALQATRPDVIGTIKAENTGGGARRRFGVREALVVAQVAGSLLLLATAGLFLRSFAAQRTVDPGFGQQPTALVTFALPANRYPVEQGLLFAERLITELRTLPDVEAVGLVGNPHLNQASTTVGNVTVEGHEPPPGERSFTIDRTQVDQGFFEAAGIRMLRGRGFGPGDVLGGTQVVVINEAMADRFWPGEDPLGRTFMQDGERRLIVGVAATAKIRNLGEAPRPFIYQPISQSYVSAPTLLVRVRGDAEAAAAAAVAALQRLDPDVILLRAQTLERFLAAHVLPARLGALAFAALAVLALTLGVIGVFGVVSHAVARRTREVGIRIALGADTGRVVGLLMRQGLLLVGIGTALGLALALATGRLLARFLFGVDPLDPLTLVVVPTLIAVAGGTAALLPALRAARVQPARVLGVE